LCVPPLCCFDNGNAVAAENERRNKSVTSHSRSATAYRFTRSLIAADQAKEAALTEMDEVTQRNSALVEENSATAKTLERQSHDIQERIASFKLDSGAVAGVRARNAA
jgi:methyl-accepting chemotaxis protein